MVTRTIFRVITPTEKALAPAVAAASSSIVEATGNEADLGALIYRETQIRQAETAEEAAARPSNDDSHGVSSINCTLDSTRLNARDVSKKRPLSSEDYSTTYDDQNSTHKYSRLTIDLTDVPHQSPILRSGSHIKDGSSKYQGVNYKYQGVAFEKQNSAWKAQIKINSAQHSSGRYDNEEEAAVDYARAAYECKAKNVLNSLQKRKQVSIDSTDVPQQPPIFKRNDTDGSLIQFQGVYSDDGNNKWRVRRDEGKKYTIGWYDNIEAEGAAIDYAGAEFKDGERKVQQGRSANHQTELQRKLNSSVACTNQILEYGEISRRLLTKTQLQTLQTPSLLVEEPLSNESIRNAPINISLSVSDMANPYELELGTSVCRRPKSTIESLLSQICESQHFDIAEVWLHGDDGQSTYHLAHSYVRSTLHKPLFQSINEVYRNYSKGSAERTHRLSSALCKWAKKMGQILRVSEHKSPRLSQALKYSVSGVQMAVAVPVCRGGVSATINLFSMTSGVALPKVVEDYYDCYLYRMSHKIVKEMESG